MKRLSPVAGYALAAAFACALFPSRLTAQQPQVMTRAQAQHIIRELDQIRSLVERMTPPGPSAGHVKVRLISDWPATGQAGAPLTLIEFTDLQCPDCRAFQQQESAALKSEFIQAGKVRLISVDITSPLFPFSLRAASAARCAGDQGQYWPYRNQVLHENGDVTPAKLLQLGTSLVANAAAFRHCVTAGAHDRDITRDNSVAMQLGARGTPSFLLGTVSNGLLSGILLRGAPAWPRFRQILDDQLRAASGRQ